MSEYLRQKQANLPSGLAVDFGGTKIAVARLVEGEIVQQVQVSTDGNADINGQVLAITDLLEQLEIRDIDSIGVAVTGRVTSAGIWHALNKKTLVNIDAIALREILSKKFTRPVNIQNDATATAIGEYIAGGGRGYDSIGFITISTGVGGGFILNGTPLISKNGLAGHAGFTTSRIATHRCGCGRNQTIESIASGKAIARYAVEAGHPLADAKAVFDAHLKNESWASLIIEQSANAIGELCANLKALLDVDIILLGGSIGLAEGYLSLVQKYLEEEPETFRPLIKHASLGLTAPYIGVLADV